MAAADTPNMGRVRVAASALTTRRLRTAVLGSLRPDEVESLVLVYGSLGRALEALVDGLAEDHPADVAQGQD